jgi:hypothetical protein
VLKKGPHDHSPGLAFCCSETVTMLAKNLTKDKGYTMCPVDTATAGSWAGVGLVN